MTDDATPSHTSRPRRRLVLLVGALVVVLGAAAGAFVVLRDDAPTQSWHPDVEPFVEIVERQRDLDFKHPVPVKFLDDEEFEETVRTDREDLEEDDEESIEEVTAMFRAFGFISGDVDLFEAFNEAHGTGTLAYYSFDDKAITIRGSKLQLASHATLVHELTHALQDQHFAIGDRYEELGEKAEHGEPSTELDAFEALVEGDAERVAELYRGTLKVKERTALEKAEEKQSESTQAEIDAMEGVPGVVTSLLGAPYALGQAMVETAATERVIDDLFADPPPDDSVLLDPLKVLGKKIPKPTEVKVPGLGSGEKEFDTGQIGSLVTYLMLAQRIPVEDALATADTWRGDAYVGFERDGVKCVRVDYATGKASADAFTDAFGTWVDAAPGSSASVERRGDLVRFESCDPGEKVTVADDVAEDALTLVATRGYLMSGVVSAGGSVKQARCFGDAALEEFTLDELTDPEFGADDPTAMQRIQRLGASCIAS